MKKLLFTIILLLPFFMLGQTKEDVQYYESGKVKLEVDFEYGLDSNGWETSWFEWGSYNGTKKINIENFTNNSKYLIFATDSHNE